MYPWGFELTFYRYSFKCGPYVFLFLDVCFDLLYIFNLYSFKKNLHIVKLKLWEIAKLNQYSWKFCNSKIKTIDIFFFPIYNMKTLFYIEFAALFAYPWYLVQKQFFLKGVLNVNYYLYSFFFDCCHPELFIAAGHLCLSQWMRRPFARFLCTGPVATPGRGSKSFGRAMATCCNSLQGATGFLPAHPDSCRPVAFSALTLDMAILQPLGTNHWRRGPTLQLPYTQPEKDYLVSAAACRHGDLRNLPVVWDIHGGCTDFLHSLAGSIAMNGGDNVLKEKGPSIWQACCPASCGGWVHTAPSWSRSDPTSRTASGTLNWSLCRK